MNKEFVIYVYMYDTYTHVYMTILPTMRKKDILLFETTRTDLEDIMLSEILVSQTEKDKYCIK